MRASRTKNTDFYEFENVNPKGRLRGDCTIRTIAKACGQSWEQTIRELTEIGIKKGYVCNDQSLFPSYLSSKGFVAHNEPRASDNTKISVKAFISKGLAGGKAIVALVGTHHVTCLMEGKVRDIWDCSGQTMHRWWSR